MGDLTLRTEMRRDHSIELIHITTRRRVGYYGYISTYFLNRLANIKYNNRNQFIIRKNSKDLDQDEMKTIWDFVNLLGAKNVEAGRRTKSNKKVSVGKS